MTVAATTLTPDFTVIFDGPAVGAGRMDVRELAPALLALADLFQDVNATVNRDGPPVSLDIKATGDGSFAVDLSPVVNMIGHAVSLFQSDGVQAAATLTGLVTGVGGIVSFVKNRKRGRREDLPTGDVRITLEDETVLTYTRTVKDLGENIEVRRRVRRVIEPLSRNGVDKVEFKKRLKDPVPMVTVTREDLPAFDMGSATDTETGAEVLTRTTREVRLRIVKPALLGHGKWRVNDGTVGYWVTMGDEAFAARVDARQEGFKAGDELQVIELTEQRRSAAGELKGERIVTDVLAVIKPPGDDGIEGQTTIP